MVCFSWPRIEKWGHDLCKQDDAEYELYGFKCVHFFLINQEYTITTTTAAHNRFITLMINAIQHILIIVDLHVIH